MYNIDDEFGMIWTSEDDRACYLENGASFLLPPLSHVHSVLLEFYTQFPCSLFSFCNLAYVNSHLSTFILGSIAAPRQKHFSSSEKARLLRFVHMTGFLVCHGIVGNCDLTFHVTVSGSLTLLFYLIQL